MNLPRATPVYDAQDQDRLRTDLERANEENLKRGRDIDLGDGRVIGTSLNGSRFALVFNNDGSLSTVAL